MSLTTAFASINLRRLPLRDNETLKAWDAADELLLNHLAQIDQVFLQDNKLYKPNVLVVNDAFGALACSLAHGHCKSWGDSFLAHQATRLNAKSNQLPFDPECIASTSKLSGEFDRVLIKIPKTLALLEQQLFELKPCLHADSIVIAAGMTKYIHNSHLKLFEKYLGPTTTSLAVKKARLVFPALKINTPITLAPYPTHYYDNDVQLTLCNHANVFSREKLDIGTRFMLKQFNYLPKLPSGSCNIVDLGCGNGVLGIMAKKHYDNIENSSVYNISFIDESYMALACVKKNVLHSFDQASHCQYFISDCFEQAPLSDIDLIVCNPPFHQNHIVGSHIATRMFKGCKKVLKQGGHLWVIANRHLNYPVMLKNIFGNYRIIAENNKFVLLAMTVR